MTIATTDLGVTVPAVRTIGPGTLAPAVASVDPRRPSKGKAPAAWFSGFCGPGPCRDTHPGPDGTPHRHCRQTAANGINATRPYLTCACTCHTNEEPHDD